jgi:hypothetical protein
MTTLISGDRHRSFEVCLRTGRLPSFHTADGLELKFNPHHDLRNVRFTLLKAGQLTPRLSDQEALGNYVDRQVRRNLRNRYAQFGVDSAGAGPVRVNRRENISSGNDLTYRRPDARVNDVAFDVTLTRKTLGTPQVRGFFNADFRPSSVVIIRPRQLGANHSYLIPRPETKR